MQYACYIEFYYVCYVCDVLSECKSGCMTSSQHAEYNPTVIPRCGSTVATNRYSRALYLLYSSREAQERLSYDLYSLSRVAGF